jgi:hypothetical protein
MLSPNVWFQYLDAIKHHMWPSARRAVVSVLTPVWPGEIEGFTNISQHAPFSDLDSSVAGVLRLNGWRVPTAVLFGLIILAAAWWSLRLFRGKKLGVPIEFACAVMIGLVLLTDLLLPIRRLSYSDAILVPIVLLLIATGGRPFIESIRNLFLVFLAILFGLELRWAFLSGLVPCLTISALAIVARWKGEPASTKRFQ